MMIFSEFKEKWESMPVVGKGFLHLGIIHSLDLQIGHTSTEFKSLIVMNTGIIKDIPSSFAIKVNNLQLQDASWILEFQLIHQSFEEEFLRLCWDMIDISRDADNPLNALINRYLSWQKFLQYESKSIMSFQSQKGLLGELLYLKQCIEEIGIERSIDAWVGPEGSDQDFIFADSWAEVETVALAADCVHISSLQQLQQEVEGFLVVNTLEKTTVEQERISLVYVSNTVREIIADNMRYLDRFEMKLYKYGYRKNHEEEYNKNCFRFVEQKNYSVSDDFPKLTTCNVPLEIKNCAYEISMGAIEKYRR